MDLWRIASETREWRADDLSGVGAARHPGRWNAAGDAVVYCAEHLSLAVLETFAHLCAAPLPLDRFVVRVAVPDDVWDARTVLDARALRATPAWQSIPAGVTSERLGREWYRTARTALLTVPSVIVPEESIVLIRAGHPDTRRIRARVVRPFRFDAVSRS